MDLINYLFLYFKLAECWLILNLKNFLLLLLLKNRHLYNHLLLFHHHFLFSYCCYFFLFKKVPQIKYFNMNLNYLYQQFFNFILMMVILIMPVQSFSFDSLFINLYFWLFLSKKADNFHYCQKLLQELNQSEILIILQFLKSLLLNPLNVSLYQNFQILHLHLYLLLNFFFHKFFIYHIFCLN